MTKVPFSGLVGQPARLPQIENPAPGTVGIDTLAVEGIKPEAPKESKESNTAIYVGLGLAAIVAVWALTKKG